jgi:hypothetical protein
MYFLAEIFFSTALNKFDETFHLLLFLLNFIVISEMPSRSFILHLFFLCHRYLLSLSVNLNDVKTKIESSGHFFPSILPPSKLFQLESLYLSITIAIEQRFSTSKYHIFLSQGVLPNLKISLIRIRGILRYAEIFFYQISAA